MRGGVDRTVAAYARRCGITRPGFPWPTGAATAKAAGPIRNQEVITDCVALIAWPGNVGTRDALARARALGRPIHRIEDELELLRLEIQRDHLVLLTAPVY